MPAGMIDIFVKLDKRALRLHHFGQVRLPRCIDHQKNVDNQERNHEHNRVDTSRKSPHKDHHDGHLHTIGNIGAQKTRGGIATAFKIGSRIVYPFSCYFNHFFNKCKEKMHDRSADGGKSRPDKGRRRWPFPKYARPLPVVNRPP